MQARVGKNSTSGQAGAIVVTRTVGISDMQTTDQPNEVLVTYSLGSCIGLTLFDPAAGVGAMLHCMLPLSKIDKAKADRNPYMFTDTGVPAMLQAIFDMGAERRRVVAKVAGAASLLDEKAFFRIGERNYTVLRRILWKNNIVIAAEDVGGTVARSMYLYMETGRTVIRARGREVEL
jgi:chemotaxis protein CheD